MEYDLLIRQHDQLVQRAQELASTSEALATSIGGDEAAISAPTAYELLTNLMDALMTLSRTTERLRMRLVASLYRTGLGLTHVDLVSGETCEPVESVLSADADILGSATSLELAERCLNRARNAIAAQVYEHATGNPVTTSRNTPWTTTN